MATTKKHLIINQGSTYSNTININNSINAVSANAMMRQEYSFSNSVAFSCSLANTNNHVLTLSLTANQTANLVATKYVYDIEITDTSNNVYRIQEGYITVNPQVTK